MIIAACDKQALALGLTPGLPLADARARVPGLAVFEHEPEVDRTFLQWLVDGSGRYTPLVEARPPLGFLLDITGCTHLWEDETGLIRNLSARLGKLALTHITALGETPEKAWALACHGDDEIRGTGDVRQLPVRALDLDADGLRALAHAGLRTIGDLACRPRIAFAARIGIAAVSRLDRLLGHEDVRISPHRHAPALFLLHRFAEPASHSAHMLAVIEQLLIQSSVMLYERAEGGRHFGVTLYRSDGDVRRLAVETGSPTRDPALLIRLFRERIDTLADPLDPGFGYDAIRLDIIRTAPLAARQKEALDESEQVDDDFGSLIDQMTTRLGAGHVLCFVPGDSHLPELASGKAPAQHGSTLMQWPEAEEGEPPLRPFTLFDPPHPVEVMVADLPDGAPATFRWRKRLHRISYAEGPERIGALWWRRKHGYMTGRSNPDRDYFRIEDDKGARFWLFRSGLYGDLPSPRWYLHGAFT